MAAGFWQWREDNDPCQETATRIYQSVYPGLNTSGLTLTLTIDGSGATGGTYTISGGATGAACAGTTAMGTQGGGTATVNAQYTCSLAVYGYTFPGCSLGTQITEVIQ